MSAAVMVGMWVRPQGSITLVPEFFLTSSTPCSPCLSRTPAGGVVTRPCQPRSVVVSAARTWAGRFGPLWPQSSPRRVSRCVLVARAPSLRLRKLVGSPEQLRRRLE
ncbi:hypothetical protein BDA96_10G340600 [Sorghum bicolor]|uniref:Uncharacterized protein n=2 Tax=Sorghum bicolor TaxID=4558 RepID=A0A1W0VV33_SORBI|nr:hypothetical protein BDA96_10G340600 [Sorghum bicolor]OQU77105.1 hypothetical protein SORBI_3010G263950 [Sorghum bicolor]